LKKHLCRLSKSHEANLYSDFISKNNKAACDPTLTVPYHSKSGRNRRLTAEEVVKQMDQGNVCKACIRIVIVERLNGIRPRQKPKPISVDFEASVENFAKAMATTGVTMKKAADRLKVFGALAETIIDGGVKIQPPIISIPKDFSFRGSMTARFSCSNDHVDSIAGLIGKVTA
jgi:hypothetical protein